MARAADARDTTETTAIQIATCLLFMVVLLTGSGVAPSCRQMYAGAVTGPSPRPSNRRHRPAGARCYSPHGGVRDDAALDRSARGISRSTRLRSAPDDPAQESAGAARLPRPPARPCPFTRVAGRAAVVGDHGRACAPQSSPDAVRPAARGRDRSDAVPAGGRDGRVAERGDRRRRRGLRALRATGHARHAS